MKKKFFTLMFMMLACVVILTGCSSCKEIKLKDAPDATSAVTSNGGLVVQQGDYLYFANGYVETDNLNNGDNDYGKVNYSAIYRAKTTNNELMYDVTEDDEGEEVKTLKNVELLIPKVVSCDTCTFFVYDNYIYYASPTTEKSSSGKSRFDLVTFFVCKNDGSQTKKLYETDNYDDASKFNIIKYGENVYIEIYDSKTITILTVNKNKVTKTETIGEGFSFTNVVFPTVTPYNPQNNTTNANDAFVYYTRDLLESESETKGNVLAKASVTDAKEVILIKDNQSTISLKDYANNTLFYTVNRTNSESYIVYTSNVETVSANDINVNNQLSLLDTENVYAIHSSDLVGVVCNIDNSLKLCVKGETVKKIYNEAVTVLKVEGNNVFAYNSSNQIVVITLDTFEARVLTSTDDTIYFSATTNFDICGNYIYYFNTYKGETETGYYLNRIEIGDDSQEGELLGVIDSKYITVEEAE